jgi:hypothetical protein
VVWRPQTPAFTTPYAAVIVNLDENYQMLSNMIGCPPEEIRLGMRVRVEFHEIDRKIHLPYFRPETGQVPAAG